MRLWLAKALAGLASLVAPRHMESVFTLYVDLLRGLPEQAKIGRRYGVVSATWCYTPSDRKFAERMMHASIEAMASEREAIKKEESGEAPRPLGASGVPSTSEHHKCTPAARGLPQ